MHVLVAVVIPYVMLLSGIQAALVLQSVRDRSAPAERSAPPKWPKATIVAVLVVGIPTIFQLAAFPSLQQHLQRDRTAIGHGEAWRLATALVVQDGGRLGALANLVMLAVVGTVAERLWGAKRWLVIALISAGFAELWGLVVQPVGGGNSIAVFGLAASMAAAAARRGPGPARRPAAVCLGCGVVLFVLGDLHGGASVVGATLGSMLNLPARSTHLAAATTP